MSGDICRTKIVEVEVQENGIIRDSQGWPMARLGDDYPFEDVVEKPIRKFLGKKLCEQCIPAALMGYVGGTIVAIAVFLCLK